MSLKATHLHSISSQWLSQAACSHFEAKAPFILSHIYYAYLSIFLPSRNATYGGEVEEEANRNPLHNGEPTGN
jgi:hypothetical protein